VPKVGPDAIMHNALRQFQRRNVNAIVLYVGADDSLHIQANGTPIWMARGMLQQAIDCLEEGHVTTEPEAEEYGPAEPEGDDAG
jgi:hypothetical protein